ncbi:MAG: hypothetical protein AAF849_12670 [Bacteroidota bacterium]
MKKLNLKFVALFAFAAFLFTACEEDDPLGSGINTPPGITLSSGAGLVSGDAVINVGESFKVEVVLSPGSSDLNTLTIFEDGSTINLARLEGVGANPALLLGANKQGTTIEVEILPDASATEEAFYSYEFRVADDEGETNSVFITIETDIPFTNIETTIEDALFNQAGPGGTGGIDLDTGMSTGSNDGEAELQDEGINNGASTVAANWRRQISGANGAEVVFVDDLGKVVEGLTFDNVEFVEQITAAFDAGIALDGDDSDCDCSDTTDDEEVSQPVNTDDIFAVRRDGRTYLVQVTAVNVTENDNNDSYQLTIKY